MALGAQRGAVMVRSSSSRGARRDRRHDRRRRLSGAGRFVSTLLFGLAPTNALTIVAATA